MSIKDIIRAWKDSNYRESLSEEQIAQLPVNPVGDVLSEEEMLAATGGMPPSTCVTAGGNVCSCTGTIYCINTDMCTGGPWCY